MEANRKLKKSISIESFVFLIFFFGAFTLIGREMGAANMLSTMMNTSYELLINTVLYITAIAVLAGALSELLSEFGVISIANIMLSPVIRFLYGLPGASIIGMFATYFSDNPAILTLADNKAFRRYFKLYQLPALTNIGTSFGMGLIITTFFISLKSPTGETFILAVIIGNVCAVIGSIISTRIMLLFTAKIYGKEADCESDGDNHFDIMKFRVVREGSVGNRILESVLDGGKFGVKMGVSIVPGVLIICTIIMMVTNGPSDVGVYTGAAFEGVAVLPAIAQTFDFILKPLFGFSSPQAIAVPITALGAAGAAISLIPEMVKTGQATANDIAVFTAFCMCWSGYLSTHVAMMESLGFRKLTGYAIFAHTVAGLVAAMAANILFKLLS